MDFCVAGRGIGTEAKETTVTGRDASPCCAGHAAATEAMKERRRRALERFESWRGIRRRRAPKRLFAAPGTRRPTAEAAEGGRGTGLRGTAPSARRSRQKARRTAREQRANRESDGKSCSEQRTGRRSSIEQRTRRRSSSEQRTGRKIRRQGAEHTGLPDLRPNRSDTPSADPRLGSDLRFARLQPRRVRTPTRPTPNPKSRKL